MNDGLSAADVMAIAKDDNWTNNPFIYLVWLALLGGGNFGGWGNNAAAAALTRSDLFDGFNMQDVNGQLRGITGGICDGFYAMNTGLANVTSTLGSAISNLQYGLGSEICGINRNIDQNRAEAYQNTCRITTAIHDEGEATRALIQANVVQDLRDRLEDKDRELLQANFAISQQVQNANLISAIRPTPIPAYVVSSPYVSNGYGCGCGI